MSFLTKSERDDLTRRIATLATKSADEAAKKAQEARAHQYHIGVKEGGNVTKPSEWASVPDSEWGDPVNYAYPMPDKAHADNAAARWGDASNRGRYSSEEQKIIGDRITHRQHSFGEKMDEKDEQKSAEDVIEPTNVTADELDETKAAKKPADDKPADDDNDAQDENDGDEDDDEEGDEEGDEAKPAKKKPAKPAEGDGDGKDGEGKGDDDSEGKGDRSDRFSGPLMEPVDEGKKKPKKDGADVVANPQTEALLASYNTLGAALGFEPVALDQKHFTDDSITEVRSLAVIVDTSVDQMLRLLGVPDRDGDVEAGGAMQRAVDDLMVRSGASLSSATKARLGQVHDALATLAGGAHCAANVPQQNSAEGDELLQKRGATISRGNMAMIGKAHDVLATMCAGMHCADFVARHSDAPAQMAAEEEAEKSGEQAIDVVAKFDKLSDSFDAMAKSFGDLKTLRDEAETVRNELALARKTLGDLKTEAAELQDNIAFYGNQPTQRPTKIAGRVAPDAPAVDFNGQVSAPSAPDLSVKSSEPTTLEEARDGAPVQYIPGVGKVRVWAKGYAVNMRPSLDTDEMSLMSPVDILSYYNGGEVRVPVIG